MKKTRVILVLITVIFVVFPAIDCFSEDGSFFDRMKKMVFGNKEISINDIVDQTQEVTEDVKDLSENYVIKSIKTYNELISKMRDEVTSKSWYLFDKSDSDKFDIMLKGIEQIRDFYVVLNDQKATIKKQMTSYIDDIERFSDELPVKISKEQMEKRLLEREHENVDSNSSYSKEEKEIRKRGYVKRIDFCERRIKMLLDFKSNYNKIIPVLDDANKSIERFMLVVQESAAVYSDAYRTLKLQKDINNAYRTIEELKSLDYLSEDIQKSWSDLEAIIKVLTNQVVGFSENG